MRYFVEWSKLFEAWCIEELHGTLPPAAYGPQYSLAEAFREAKLLAGWLRELP